MAKEDEISLIVEGHYPTTTELWTLREKRLYQPMGRYPKEKKPVYLVRPEEPKTGEKIFNGEDHGAEITSQLDVLAEW